MKNRTLALPRQAGDHAVATTWTRRLLGSVAVAAVAALAAACTPVSTDGPQASSPQRQAVSEYDLARDAFYKGHLREALNHAQISNKLDDQNAKALYFTAVIYLGFCITEGEASPDCRIDTAEAFTRRAIKVEPQFRDAKNALGQILIQEKKYDEALKILEPLTKDPAYVANYLAWGNYGWALVLLGRTDEGIAALRNSITEPRFCVGQYRLGMAYENKGDFVAAEQSFSDAVGVPSADCQALQDAWFERARVRMKLGKTSEAQGDFARCRQIGAKTEKGKECANLAGDAQPTPVQPITPAPGTGGGAAPSATQPEATAASSQ
ncbi:MAG: tetratricopeptide repeat protein [Polyangiaceae bacterium]|jgi:type IV pilus assembly protein PilF